MDRMKHRINRGILFIPIVIGGIFLFTWGVMLLWNAVLPAAIPAVKAITFWQAMGIFVLSKILFGFNKGWGGRRSGWKERMDKKWRNLTPEEKEKIKGEWQHRCGRWGMRSETTDSSTAAE